jgi:hypothetical protein
MCRCVRVALVVVLAVCSIEASLLDCTYSYTYAFNFSRTFTVIYS